MTTPRIAVLVVLLMAACAACARGFVPAVMGTPMDEACSAFNAAQSGPLDSFAVGPARVAVPKGWTPRYPSPQELELTRIGAELNVWLGSKFKFPAVAPRNAIRCTITRRDTTVAIQATRTGPTSYRVDVSWEPQINGQYFYMQLQTQYTQQLKAMRGIVEGVRFPADTVRASAPR